MKKIILAILIIIFTCTTAFAKEEDWSTEKTKDGKFSVKSRVQKIKDENGEKKQLIEYETSIIADIEVKKCVKLLKDVSKHKIFLDEDTSEIIGKISENEWLVYYYSDVPWPIKESDTVAKMTFSENRAEKVARFDLTAAPDKLKKMKKYRMTQFDQSFVFTEVEKGKTKIEIMTKVSPVSKVPNWLMKSYFPEGPADILRKLVDIAKEL